MGQDLVPVFHPRSPLWCFVPPEGEPQLYCHLTLVDQEEMWRVGCRVRTSGNASRSWLLGPPEAKAEAGAIGGCLGWPAGERG